MPSSPEEFREFAQECLRWAGETKSERHHQALLEMSRTWIQAALEVERGRSISDPRTSSFSRLTASQASGSPLSSDIHNDPRSPVHRNAVSKPATTAAAAKGKQFLPVSPR